MYFGDIVSFDSKGIYLNSKVTLVALTNWHLVILKSLLQPDSLSLIKII
jgi:hypothetical protein